MDTIVTDKKGNYLTDLTAKDFKVWEDNKEQPIKSFSVESGSSAPSESHRHYLVLLFDNSTMKRQQTRPGRAMQPRSLLRPTQVPTATWRS